MGNRKKVVRKSARSTRSNKQLDNSFGALLVKKTLCRRPTYTYMLTAADIGKLAPHYRLLLEPDDAFNVIGSKRQLGEVLDAYGDNDRRGVLSLILHVAPLHWATMIVNGRDVYFTDSLDYELLSEYDEALKERPELHLSDYSSKQQNDGHNCGFWALMNAEAIRRQIHDYGPNSGCFPCVLPSISSGWQAIFFATLRRDMAKRVEEHDTDGESRAVVLEEDEPSNSSQAVPKAKAPATAQRRKAKAPKKGTTDSQPADKRKKTEARPAGKVWSATKQSSDRSSASVVDDTMSKKRTKEVMDEDRPKKKQKGQAEEAEFESSDDDDGASSYVQCKICWKKFRAHKQLLDHNRCHKPLNLECEICDYRTNRQTNLDAHMTRRHEKEVNSKWRHKCLKCRRTFKYLRTLKAHTKECSA